MGGWLSTRDAGPRDPAKRTALAAPGPRLCFLLSPGPHPRLSGKRYAESPPDRAQAVTKRGCDFKRPNGRTPSSVFLARSGVRPSSPICHRGHGGSKQYSPEYRSVRRDPGAEDPRSADAPHRFCRTEVDQLGRQWARCSPPGCRSRWLFVSQAVRLRLRSGIDYPQGFSCSHFRFMQNRKNARSVPSRFPFARAPRFQPP